MLVPPHLMLCCKANLCVVSAGTISAAVFESVLLSCAVCCVVTHCSSALSHMVSAIQWQGMNTLGVGQIFIKPTKASEHTILAQETSCT